MPHDAVLSPSHYVETGSIECITITEQLSFNLGNCIKYCFRWRAKNGIEDLKKALWYLEREQARRAKMWFWQRWWQDYQLRALAIWLTESREKIPFPANVVLLSLGLRDWKAARRDIEFSIKHEQNFNAIDAGLKRIGR